MQVAAGAAFHTSSATDGRHDTVSVGCTFWGSLTNSFGGLWRAPKPKIPSEMEVAPRYNC